MEGLPPLPPGFVLDTAPPPPPPPKKRADPWEVLKTEGFVATNGFRTKGDVERIRAQGYKPASNGAHNRGDGIDLDHPSLTPAQQTQRLRELFGDWEGAFIDDEGHHRHMQLPGWGAAPGTPGTPNSGLPPVPEGFELVQRGPINSSNFVERDAKAARIATIKQNGFDPAEEAKLVAAVENEAPLVESQTAGVAFNDELPGELASRLQPQQVANWYKLARDPKSTPDDLRGLMKAYGYDIANADEVVAARNKGLGVNADLTYKLRPAAPNADGAVGAGARGVADPINILDEMGAVVDTLGGTEGRESVWNSDRGVKDILFQNIDLNRGVLQADERDHFGARFGGQLASGILLPFGAGARGAAQLAKYGAIEGAVAGFGAGEGNPFQRAPNAAAGAALGATGGYALGRVIDGAAPVVRSLFGRGDDSAPSQFGMSSEKGMEDATEPTGVYPESPAGLSLLGSVQAGRGAGVSPVGDRVPPVRAGNDLPPIPEGFVLDEPAIGRTRPAGERVSAEEVAELARGVNPEDVTPIPANLVESPDELPTSIRAIEGPESAGRTPKRPARFTESLKARLAADTAQAGVPVRIDAEDAINNGVPAELIYKNPDVVDKAQLQLRNPSLFGTRYGRMSSNQQVLRSLDMDDVDPVEWGFDNLAGQRLGPEDIGDLLRRDLEGDPSALQRGSAYDAWTAHQERAAQRTEFERRYPDGPPVEQRGETITLDDLNALEPPASAYEDRARFTGMIGNINLDRLESPEDVSRLISQVQGKVGGFDEAKRGVVTNEETRKLADELGLKPEDLLKRRRGQALNAEQLYATRVLVQKSREVVGRPAKQAVGGTDEQVAAFRNAWMRHVALEEQVTAATAEVGRAMQSFKMLAKAGDAKAEAVKAYLKGGGGRETVEEAAQKLVDLMEDPAQANRFLRDGAKARTRDMINEFWINSLLSGPRTHVVNFVSNGLVALYTLPEQLLTAGVGAALRTEGRVTGREVGRRAVGMIQGAREGLFLAKRALLTGEPYDAISKVEAVNYEAIPGRLGKVIRTPTRFLTASDELWKAINRSAETHALAYRQSVARGGSPEQRLENYRELVLNPTGNMMKQADAAARYYTFQKELGTGGKAVQTFSNNVPLAKFVLPFVRTPINILKFAAERSLLAPAMKEVRDAIKAGGTSRDEALARITMGSGLSAMAVMAALDGKISAGGPSDYREASSLRNSGWQPYSVKIGDSWVSYQRFEPLSLLAGVAADFAEVGNYATSEERESVGLALSMAVAKNITSKTWLSGLSDFFEMLSDPERHGRRFFERLGGSMAVPAVAAHAAGSMDPYLRDTSVDEDGLFGFASSILANVRNRIPVVSQGLPVRRNIWGEEMKRSGSLGPDFISPVYVSRESASPLLREVGSLKAALSMPNRSLRIDGKTVRLTREQYDAYLQLSGKPAKQYLEQFITTREWRSMDADTKREFLKETMKEFRASAREGLKEMFPELQTGGKLPPMPKGYEMPPLPPGFELER